MTHTLHRLGSEESVSNDYVLLMVPAPGYNVRGAAPKHKAFLEMVVEHGAVNYGVFQVGRDRKSVV